MRSHRNFQLSRLMMIAATISALSVSSSMAAEVKNWQPLLQEAKTADESGDKSFACFKLRQAWNAVADPSFTDPAYKTIYEQLSKLLVDQNDFKVWKNVDGSFKRQDNFLVNEWKNWKIAKTSDDSFVITAGPRAFMEGCWLGKEGRMSTKEGRVAEAGEDKFRQLANVPLKIDRNSPKYSDMSKICGDLKTGESKQVDFNLAPFIPASYIFVPPMAAN